MSSVTPTESEVTPHEAATSTSNDREYLTVYEAADRLRCTPWTVYKHVREGLIPFRRIGKFILIPAAFLSPDKARIKKCGDAV
jgi:excisionase family DNA binding protein